MQFSPQQELALTRVKQWLKGDDQLLYLAGYAGTGKTTLAQHLQATHFAAYTGKAASVMRSKGCPDASTIHRLIYNPKGKSQARLRELLLERYDLADDDPKARGLDKEIQLEQENISKPSFTLNLDSPLRHAKLLVVDECSMVNEQIGKDLLSFGCKVLVLGDPAQLPPTHGGGYFTEREPDVLLTEVHRQARNNPILDLATIIRATGVTPRKHPCVVQEVTPAMAMAVDQLIVGRNKTRHATNSRMRQLLGFVDTYPQPGEKVVCLSNDHQLGILNGSVYTVEESSEDFGCIEMLLCSEGTDTKVLVQAHPEIFEGKEVDYRVARDYQHFDFGYALTCHKSQGSQWGSVGVVDESRAFGLNARRWLYTAVTRAAEELWVAV